MQNLAFSHFGAGFQTAGAANSVAADFTTAKNSGKMGLWQASRSDSSEKIALSQGIMQSKATNSVFSGVRAVFALSRARVSSLSLSLSLSRSGVFAF